MLRPIPRKILTHSVTFQVASGVDVWQNPTVMEYPVFRVCVQPDNRTVTSRDNTAVTLNAVCFIDARRSVLPYGFDPAAAKDESEAHGAPLRMAFAGRTYTVQRVETDFDDEGGLHHWEVELV